MSVHRSSFVENLAGNAVTSSDCVGGSGGALSVASATVTNTTFFQNQAGSATNNPTHGKGGAIQVIGAATIVNCLLTGNTAPGADTTATGGAIDVQSDLKLVNCTLVANTAPDGSGGGVSIASGATLDADNCILWDNSDSGGTGESAQLIGFDGDDAVDYSIVQGLSGALGGAGNTGADPLFVNPGAGDYHLDAASPGIDSGNCFALPIDSPEVDLDNALRIVDNPDVPNTGAPFPTYLDRGPYEIGGSSYCPGDFDGNFAIDIADLAIFLSQFGSVGAGLAGDMNRDGVVDLADLTQFLSRFGAPC